jgi:hypothetical protein
MAKSSGFRTRRRAWQPNLGFAHELYPSGTLAGDEYWNGVDWFAVAAKQRDGQLDTARDRLHASCLACHTMENVQHFRDAVERIRSRAR